MKILIWKRYILKKFWSTLIIFSILAFVFYASVHHSLHTIKSSGQTFLKISWGLHLKYYLAQIGLKTEFILPQLIAITSTITLFSMQNKREIILLKSSGLSTKQFLQPLLVSCYVLTLFLYASFQWIYPLCEKVSIQKTISEKGRDLSINKIPSLYLKDQSVMIYSSINRKSKTLHHVFWVKEPTVIYAIDQLDFNTLSLPIGFGVIKFSNQVDSGMQLQQYFDIKEFPEIEFGTYDNPFSKIFIAKNKNRFSELFKAIPWNVSGIGFSTQIPQRVLSLMSQFYYMLFSPIACVTTLLLSAHFCLRFNRIPSIALAYLIPLGVINIFFIFLKAGIVLANSSVLPVLPVILIPIIICSSISMYIYSHLN